VADFAARKQTQQGNFLGWAYNPDLGMGQRTTGLSVRAQDVRDLPPEVLTAWADLEERALEPNAYLSPHFVLPSARHINPGEPLVALLVERGSALVAVLVARPVAATRAFPVPHLVAYRSRYSFLSGILLDREYAEEALEALLDHLGQRKWGWYGIELDAVWGEGATWELLRRISQRRWMRLQVWNETTRAVLKPHADRAQIEESEAAESKSLRRRFKRLCEMGKVSWSILARGGIPEASTEAFIDLEHRGWKGDNRSSLRSNAASEAFFREVVARFGGQDRAVFVELQLDGRVVAATSNFISGQAGFAFKIGWLPELATVSPGRFAELGLVRQLYSHEALSRLQFWDSGAQEGSYIEKLWPGRRPLVTLGVGCSLVGSSALTAVQTARWLKRRLRARWPMNATPEPAPSAAPAPASNGKPTVRPSA
jgi:hypothetical protein